MTPSRCHRHPSWHGDLSRSLAGINLLSSDRPWVRPSFSCSPSDCVSTIARNRAAGHAVQVGRSQVKDQPAQLIQVPQLAQRNLDEDRAVQHGVVAKRSQLGIDDGLPLFERCLFIVLLLSLRMVSIRPAAITPRCYSGRATRPRPRARRRSQDRQARRVCG
jgi:hypothetical protein